MRRFLLRLPFLLLIATTLAPAAFGQRLWSERDRYADGPAPPRATADALVEVDGGLLERLPDRLEIPLPDGNTAIVRRLHGEPRGIESALWQGAVEGAPFEGISATFTLHRGLLVGRLFTAEGNYRVAPAPGGLHRVEPVPTREQTCAGPVIAPRELAPGIVERSLGSPELLQPRANATLDILSVYTPAAAAAFGGPAATQAALAGAVDYLTASMRNSEVPGRARLVGTAEVPWLGGKASMNDHLGRVRKDPEVNALRDTLQADIVTLWVAPSESTSSSNDSTTFGIAYLMIKGDSANSHAPWAFNVVRSDAGDDTFAHEVGHNVGLNHDPSNASIDPSFAWAPYAFGYLHGRTNRFRTLMSYGFFPIIPYFSNPLLEWKGTPIGTADQDNARAFQETVYIGARFRGRDGGGGGGNAPEPLVPPVGAAAATLSDGSVRLSWSDAGTATTVQAQLRSPSQEWTDAGDADAATGELSVEGLAAETPFTFRLRSADGDRFSDWGEWLSVTTGGGTGPCREDRLCLLDDRFEVSVQWRNPPEESHGGATPVPVAGSQKTGLFWFFNPTNVELIVKMLDGRPLNGAFWTFYGALSDVEYWISVRDTEGGVVRTYHNPATNLCGLGDVESFPTVTEGATAGLSGGRVLSLPAVDRSTVSRQEATGGCVPDETTLCLRDGRFAITVEWTNNLDSTTGPGRVVDELGTDQSGFFWFFDAANLELAVKLLDGQPINGRFWFFWGALSDVEYRITVTDTETGTSVSYDNEQGNLCGGADIEAL